MTTSEEPDSVTDESGWSPSGTLGIPVDLVFVIALTIAITAIATVPQLDASAVRIFLGVLFVLFAPGYATVAALFPERRSAKRNKTGRVSSPEAIGGMERLGLSVGMSLAIVPLLALFLNLSSVAFELESLLTVLGGFTIVTCIVAVRRRLSVTAARRFRVPYRQWLRSARTVFSTTSPLETIPILVIVVSLLIAGTAVSQTVMSTGNAETYTEFYLLNGSEDGVGQATNYTTTLASSEPHSVVVGIGNHEGQPVDYVVIVRLQRMRMQDNTSTPIANEELTRFETRVAPNRTEEKRIRFTPTMTGERLRLQFLLYKENVPSTPSRDTAYREIHLWVSVS